LKIRKFISTYLLTYSTCLTSEIETESGNRRFVFTTVSTVRLKVVMAASVVLDENYRQRRRPAALQVERLLNRPAIPIFWLK